MATNTETLELMAFIIRAVERHADSTAVEAALAELRDGVCQMVRPLLATTHGWTLGPLRKPFLFLEMGRQDPADQAPVDVGARVIEATMYVKTPAFRDMALPVFIRNLARSDELARNVFESVERLKRSEDPAHTMVTVLAAWDGFDAVVVSIQRLRPIDLDMTRFPMELTVAAPLGRPKKRARPPSRRSPRTKKPRRE